MNQFPDLGSTWKGRVLLSAVVFENEKPRLESQKMDSSIVSKFTAVKPSQEYILTAEILYGEGYPDPKEKYAIEIRWANYEILFPAIHTTKGLWEWYEKRKMKAVFFPENEPDVFVYLRSGNKKLSFIRKKFKDILNNFNQLIDLHHFQVSKDKYPELKDDKAGIVKMRITAIPAIPKEKSNILETFLPENIKKPSFHDASLYIHIYNVILSYPLIFIKIA